MNELNKYHMHVLGIYLKRMIWWTAYAIERHIYVVTNGQRFHAVRAFQLRMLMRTARCAANITHMLLDKLVIFIYFRYLCELTNSEILNISHFVVLALQPFYFNKFARTALDLRQRRIPLSILVNFSFFVPPLSRPSWCAADDSEILRSQCFAIPPSPSRTLRPYLRGAAPIARARGFPAWCGAEDEGASAVKGGDEEEDWKKVVA